MRRQGEEGAAAVEFALVLPILVVLLLGMMEFGLVFYRQQVITNASREGARAGIIVGDPRPTEAEIRNVVESYLTSASLDTGSATISVTGAQGISGSSLTVRVQYPYNFIALNNFIGSLGANLILSAQTVMQQE